MTGITDKALTPQQLYDYVQQVMESPDGDKLPPGVLQLLNSAKLRAIRTGAVSSHNDEEKKRVLTLSERISNAVEKAVREASVIVGARIFSYGNGFIDNAFLKKIALSPFNLNLGLLVKATHPYHSPSIKTNLLTESFKWARAPPLKD